MTLYEIKNQLHKDYAELKDWPKVTSYPILRKENLSNEVAAELMQKLSHRDSYLPPAAGHSLTSGGNAELDALLRRLPRTPAA
jgi:hypothetical protein